MFVDYSYYLNTFAGMPIPAEVFHALEREAERYLKYITRGAYADSDDPDTVTAVKNALCAAIEAIYSFDQEYKDIPAGISSESTDGHSVTFVKNDADQMSKRRQQIMYDIFVQELFDTGMLYQGVS